MGMNGEDWLWVRNYEGLYLVSNYGRIKSMTRNIIRKPQTINGGYKIISLSKNGCKKPHLVHRLVAEVWLPKSHKKEVHHKDENPANNCWTNLEWVTPKENSNKGTRNKRISESMTNGAQCMPVQQTDLKGNHVRFWLSAIEAEIAGFNSSLIYRCVKDTNKTHLGYRWKRI